MEDKWQNWALRENWEQDIEQEIQAATILLLNTVSSSPMSVLSIWDTASLNWDGQ